jgi:hypothetical protein
MDRSYWFVQDFHSTGRVGPEQRCTGCADAIAKIRAFSKENTDPGLILRVYVPPQATAEERRQIHEIGVSVI